MRTSSKKPANLFLRILRRLRELLNLQILAVFLVASLFLAAVGWRTYQTISDSVEINLKSWLTDIVRAEAEKVENWYILQRSIGYRMSDLDRLDQIVADLLSLADQDQAATRLLDPARTEELRKLIGPESSKYGFSGYQLIRRDGFILFSTRTEQIGTNLPAELQGYLGECLAGVTTVSQVYRSQADTTIPNNSHLYVGAPIRDDAGEVVALLSFEINPAKSLGALLKAARTSSVETYLYDEHSQIISLESGSFPVKALGVGLGEGVDLRGYEDYQGKRVIGSWRWLERYKIGVVTEVEHRQAYRTVGVLLQSFAILFALLVASTFGTMLASYALIVFRRQLQEQSIEVRQLGQYTLEYLIGKGGMGEVYKAHHVMLRRPTAVKLIYSDQVGERRLKQFEREVQLTSRLTHPNTIAVYDYGRTPENIFYYAMEYLVGINLEQLVSVDGPQAGARLIHILTRICSSLEEAHGIGLVHRDIKPANVMLCQLGGMYDVVKVLDFGLVREISDAQSLNEGVFAGSIRFMAPEAITDPLSVDYRADIYSVGALAYYVLTGTHVFQAKSALEYHAALIAHTPRPPSERLGRKVPADLELIIMRCLERDPRRRPPSIRAVSELLGACQDQFEWGEEDARRWWRINAEKVRAQRESAEGQGTLGASEQSFVVDVSRRA